MTAYNANGVYVPVGMLYDTLNTGQTAATDYTNAIAFTYSTK